MGRKPSPNKAAKMAREEFSLRGHDVVIVRQGDREIAQIDGRVMDYHRADDGYLLKLDAYQHPAKTLKAAVERYLEHEEAR